MGNFFKKGERDTVIGYMVQRNVYAKNHIYENFGGYVVTADIKDWIGLIPAFTNQEHYYEVSVNVSDVIRYDPQFILTNKITVIRELDIESRQKKSECEKIVASEQNITFPFKMYKIRLEDVQITVTCEKCTERGYVSKDCCRCGGKGIHNKTVKKWRVASELVSIIKIDREKEDSTFKGSLRYWTGLSEFYNEEKRLLHFNKSDAQTECDRRNKI